MMERQQAPQEERLLRLRMEMETDSLEVVHQSRDSPPPDHRGCFRCMVAVATIMGLVIVALVVCFVLYYSMFMPSCNQVDPPMTNTEQLSVTCKLKKTDEEGTYDIFTADKVATYQILGWVKLQNVSSEEREIRLFFVEDKKNRTLQKQKADKTDVFFYNKVRMIPHMKIRIHLRSNYTDCLFHVSEPRNQGSIM